ncbi:archease [Nonomuraea basaltis]|uniref:archease n=1 Tax=Nonomuraea basaltis TaxID=2495887 RepID=UPI00110C6968|nr:archease [Nonomuraea basaltis]TMR94648.1 archease [Nonomuraea basaltis]
MSRGHRAVPHTADIAVEAWADSREGCLAEAVRGLVESFADIGRARPDDSVTFVVTEESDEEVLAAVLQEVIYQIEVSGRLAVDVSTDEPTEFPVERVEVRLATVPVETVEQIGAMPKAVAQHNLRFGRAGGVWWAHVVVDV